MRKREKAICPRCGRPISYFEKHKRGDRTYIIAVHYLGYSKDSKGRIKKRVKKCYLGPEEAYEYVTRTHAKEGLVLRGLIDRDRVLSYLDSIIDYLERNPQEIESREFIKVLKELRDVLRRRKRRGMGDV